MRASDRHFAFLSRSVWKLERGRELRRSPAASDKHLNWLYFDVCSGRPTALAFLRLEPPAGIPLSCSIRDSTAATIE